MSLVAIAGLKKTGSLAAGVPTAVDCPSVGPARTVVVNIKNTGANPITGATAAKSPLGAAGAVSPAIEFTDVAFAALRVTLTSALGTTYEIELQSY
jgi:hypothetical protein